MREILFRGKAYTPGLCYNPCPNGWIYGFYGTKDGASFISEGGKYASGKSFFSDALVAPETVGQYTGLKDKNGQRIFEGDIVRWTSKNTYLTSNYTYMGAYGCGSILVVVALESGFTLRPIEDNAPEVPNANSKIDNYSFWNHHNQLEVIGNIHDNPELLQQC